MASAVVKLQCCLVEVGQWMSSNQLKLNADKAELPGLDLDAVVLLWVTAVSLFNSQQTQYFQAMTLGCLERHCRLQYVRSTAFYRLRQIRRVWRSSHLTSAARLTHAFITTCIDYCNVLLMGAPKAMFDKFCMRLQVLLVTKKFDHGLLQLLCRSSLA